MKRRGKERKKKKKGGEKNEKEDSKEEKRREKREKGEEICLRGELEGNLCVNCSNWLLFAAAMNGAQGKLKTV